MKNQLLDSFFLSKFFQIKETENWIENETILRNSQTSFFFLLSKNMVKLCFI